MGDKTIYISLSELNNPQTRIMELIDVWVHQEKTPIPLKEVIKQMEKKGIDKNTTIYSLKILVKNGYIRRSLVISNKTSFVQLRRI